MMIEISFLIGIAFLIIMSLEDFSKREINPVYPLVIFITGLITMSYNFITILNLILFLLICILLFKKETMAIGDSYVLFSISASMPIISIATFASTYLVFFGSLLIFGVFNAFLYYKYDNEPPFVHVIAMSYLLTIFLV